MGGGGRGTGLVRMIADDATAKPSYSPTRVSETRLEFDRGDLWGFGEFERDEGDVARVEQWGAIRGGPVCGSLVWGIRP